MRWTDSASVEGDAVPPTAVSVHMLHAPDDHNATVVSRCHHACYICFLIIGHQLLLFCAAGCRWPNDCLTRPRRTRQCHRRLTRATATGRRAPHRHRAQPRHHAIQQCPGAQDAWGHGQCQQSLGTAVAALTRLVLPADAATPSTCATLAPLPLHAWCTWRIVLRHAPLCSVATLIPQLLSRTRLRRPLAKAVQAVMER